MTEPLMTFKSHTKGKNADVAIFTDRIEWTLAGLLGTGGKLALGATTGGLSLLKTGLRGRQQGSEMIPVKSISSVTTEKDGFVYTKVKVICSGNTIDFRVAHTEAQTIKDLIGQLILGSHLSQAGAPAMSSTPTSPPPGAGGLADELRKLAELRDAGVLTDDEFAAQKAKLLG